MKSYNSHIINTSWRETGLCFSRWFLAKGNGLQKCQSVQGHSGTQASRLRQLFTLNHCERSHALQYQNVSKPIGPIGRRCRHGRFFKLAAIMWRNLRKAQSRQCLAVLHLVLHVGSPRCLCIPQDCCPGPSQTFDLSRFCMLEFWPILGKSAAMN